MVRYLSVFVLLASVCRMGLGIVGFYSLSDTRTPKVINDVASSVFRLVLFSEKPVATFSQSTLAGMAAFSVGFDKKLLQAALEDCIKNQKPGDSADNNCPIYFQSTGTAFLWGDAQTLLTCRHCLESDPLIQSEKSDGTTNAGFSRNSRVPIRVVLYNDRDEMVLDSRQAPSLTEVVFVGDPTARLLSSPPSRVGQLERNLTANLADFAVISLQRRLDQKPLESAKGTNQVPVGENIFVVGFPGPSGNYRREHFSAPDSDGFKQYVSFGKTISTEELKERNRDELPELRLTPDLQQLLRSRLLVTDADAREGNSGGPVLDEKGEVVSLACRFRRIRGHREGGIGTGGVTMAWLEALRRPLLARQ